MSSFFFARNFSSLATGLLSAVLLTNAAFGQRYDEPFAIRTIAGLAGSSGSANGSGTAARFSYPYAIARDSGGNLFVADTFNYTIRKIAPDGGVTTLAGLAEVPGSADGMGNAARFNTPYAVAVDAAGYLYVADAGNHTIRKITPAGLVSTLAGLAGVSGSSNGMGNAARFNLPNSVCVDGAGNVYVADTFNHTVRKIDPSGLVTTVAGLAGSPGTADGAGAAARFNGPFGIASDGAGLVYVADTFNHSIRKIAADGVVSTLAGAPGFSGSNDGVGYYARFKAPRGLAVDGSGNVYVADEGNHLMRKLTPAGVCATLAGSPDVSGSADGTGSGARFSNAAGVAVSSAGSLYIADTYNHTIRRGAAPLKDGTLDFDFAANDFTNGWVSASVRQADGKIVIAGSFNKVHGAVRHGVARLNADGTLDETFDPGKGADGAVNTIVANGDKFIIVGNFWNVDNTPRQYVAQLNSDGSLDSVFNPARVISYDGFDDGKGNATNPGNVRAALCQPDGKVVLAGFFGYVITGPGTSVVRGGIARFQSDGSLDSGFDPGIGVQSNGGFGDPFNIARESSGKIILLGGFDTFGGTHPVPGLVRLNSDGSFDETFAPVSADEPYSVSGILVQSDDRFVLHGYFTSIAGAARPGLARLHNSGALDKSFNPPVFGNYNALVNVAAVKEDANQKLLVGGYFHSVDGAAAHNLVRLETNGARDTEFDSSLAAGPLGYHVSTIIVSPDDGKLFVGGYFATFGGSIRPNMAVVASDGSLDNALDGLSGASDYGPQIYSLAVQPDGKILAGGFFSFFNGAPRYNLVRLNPNGTLDPSFSNSAQTEGSVRAIALQSDGKILIGGNVRTVDGVARGRLARLNSDGTLDLAFNPAVGFDGTIFALATDSAGNIYVGGSFFSFNGVVRGFIAKLDSAGNLDPAFAPGQGPNSIVYALLLGEAPDTILLGGAFSNYSGTSAGRIVRISAATGARDTTFNGTGSGFSGSVRTLQRTSAGKYYVGGSFSFFNGVYRGGLARLENDGALDSSFVPMQAGGNELIQASVLDNGRLVTGGFYLGTWPHPARFLSAGERDGTFGVGTGLVDDPLNAYTANAQLAALAIQADGKILAGGVFNRFDGVPRIALVRLRADAPLAFTAVSRKTHGAAGVFDINLPLTGSSGVECRRGPVQGEHQIVLNFASDVTVGGAFIKDGIGQVAGLSGGGTDTVTVNLTGISDQQRITLLLAGVTNGTQEMDVSVSIGALLGDTNGNGSVNVSDVAQAKSQSGQTLSLSNFRMDVNANGSINVSDIAQVKAQSGTALP